MNCRLIKIKVALICCFTAAGCKEKKEEKFLNIDCTTCCQKRTNEYNKRRTAGIKFIDDRFRIWRSSISTISSTEDDQGNKTIKIDSKYLLDPRDIAVLDGYAQDWRPRIVLLKNGEYYRDNFYLLQWAGIKHDDSAIPPE